MLIKIIINKLNFYT